MTRKAQREARLLALNVTLSATIIGFLSAMTWAAVYPHGIIANALIVLLS